MVDLFHTLFPGVAQSIDLFILGIKVIVLLFIISFVRSRFGGGPIVTVMVVVLGYLLLFQYSLFFIPGMLIYILIMFGLGGILMDIMITKPWQWRRIEHGGMEAEGPEMPERMRHMRQFRGRMMR